MSTANQRQCLHQYFFNGNQIGFNMQFCIVTPVLSYRMKMQKPFLPLYPIVDNAGFLIADTVANMQTAPELMYRIAEGCLDASNKYVVENVAGNVYEAGDYGNYLNLKVNGEAYNKQRFDFTNQLAYNFIRTLAPATTPEEFLQKVDAFIEVIKREADPRMFLAPGEYYFADAMEPNNALGAYAALSPDFKGFAALEIQSIV